MADAPLAIDLFCGKDGWTNELLKVGFRVIGFDIVKQPSYRGEFVQQDILEIAGLRHFGARVAVCSSPCEEFSMHCMKHFHPNPKYPANGIKLFNHSRSLLEALEIPYVMENVRCAQKFVGPAVNHCGPFYLWGNAVPAIFQRDCYAQTKAMSQARDRDSNGKRIYAAQADRMWSTKRKTVVAMIPESIARAVAEGLWKLATSEPRKEPSNGMASTAKRGADG